MYVSIGRLDSELLSNSMKVSRGGIIMKSHCCDADTYNRKVGLFLRNARVSFIMQSTVYKPSTSLQNGTVVSSNLYLFTFSKAY